MMLLERWVVAAMLGVGLVSMAGDAAGQSSRKPKAVHPKAAQPNPVVQPDDGAPPDQAVAPDQNAPIEHGMPPPPPEPQPEEAVQPEPVPPPQQAVQQDQKMQPDPAAEQATQPAARPAPPAETRQPEAEQQETAQQPQTPLEKETAELLRLARELKAEVEKAGNNTLSLAALRKADEVQKLARDLREKMRVQ